MKEIVRAKYKQVIELWTPEFQIMMLNEEMAELTIAINKMMRLKSSDTQIISSKRCDILTELADVRIMIEQMQVLFKISDEEIEEEYIRKLAKMEQQLNSQK